MSEQLFEAFKQEGFNCRHTIRTIPTDNYYYQGGELKQDTNTLNCIGTDFQLGHSENFSYKKGITYSSAFIMPAFSNRSNDIITIEYNIVLHNADTLEELKKSYDVGLSVLVDMAKVFSSVGFETLKGNHPNNGYHKIYVSNSKSLRINEVKDICDAMKKATEIYRTPR